MGTPFSTFSIAIIYYLFESLVLLLLAVPVTFRGRPSSVRQYCGELEFLGYDATHARNWNHDSDGPSTMEAHAVGL